MSLLYIGQEVTIYGGLFLVVAGVIGNGMNIFIFSSVRNYRSAPCTFYFLIASIFNIMYITINLISRIVSTGYGFDLTRTSTAWCKIRTFCLFTLSLITLTCSCLATIDQYFATSQNVRLRRYSNIKWAHRIVIIMIIIWCFHGIAPLIFFEIPATTKTCMNINSGYDIYARIYLLGLVCAIPVFVMITFGCLIYNNIRQTEALARQCADRQITKMILVQVVLIVICIGPYGIYNTYSLITNENNKDTDQLIKEAFALTIFSLLCYFYYAVCSSSFDLIIKKKSFFFYLGKLLHVFDCIKSFSSDST
jgi:hypothetical protein